MYIYFPARVKIPFPVSSEHQYKREYYSHAFEL